MNTPSTGANPHTALQYDVQLVIPGATQAHPPLIFQNVPVAAVELVNQQGFHALIGRDILAGCLFVYNGERGFFMLAY